MDNHAELHARVHALPWFHSIDLGNGIVTPGDAPLDDLKKQADAFFPASLAGKAVLDIGCYNGFFSFDAMRRGADRVVALDHFIWQHWPKSREAFELARSVKAPLVEPIHLDLWDLTSLKIGYFDYVLFAGVFYHLRHPWLALEKIAALTRETIVVETHMDAADIDKPAMILYPGSSLNADWTNWWGPNRACVEAMLRDVGFPNIIFTVNPVHATRGIFIASR